MYRKIESSSWGKGLVLVDDHKSNSFFSFFLFSFLPKFMDHVIWYLFMPVMRMAYHPYQLNHAQQFCRNIGGYRAINKSFSSHFWSSRSLVLKGANLTPILMIYYSIVILNLLPIHKRLFR